MSSKASRGVTKVELSAGVTLVALAVLGANLFFTSRSQANADAVVVKEARSIAHAAENYRSDNGGGCPTLSVLKHEGVSTLPNEDPWGERYLIECDDDEVRVVSSGKDRTMDTSDDISVTP